MRKICDPEACPTTTMLYFVSLTMFLSNSLLAFRYKLRAYTKTLKTKVSKQLVILITKQPRENKGTEWEAPGPGLGICQFH